MADPTENAPVPPADGPFRGEPDRVDPEWMYRALAAADVGVFEVDIPRRIRRWDATTKRLVGVDPATFQGTDDEFLAAVHPEDRDLIARHLPGTIVPGDYHSEFRVVWPDGSEHHLTVQGTVVAGADGRAARMVGVIWESTRRRLAEEALRKIEVAVEQSPVTVTITDLAGAIEYVNPAFTATTGYTRDEVLGRNPRLLKAGSTDPELYRQLWATLARGEVWKGEFCNRKKNGELFWEAATIAPIRGPSGAVTHYVALKEDITQDRRNQRLLQELNERLEDRIRERTAMLEAANTELDAFSYSVSHDLRAPLRGIDGFSLALVEEFGDLLGEEGRHYLRRVRAGVVRMGQLIDDLLKLSRFSRSELNRSALDLTAMARALLDDLQRSDPARAADLHVEEGLAASGDPGLVRVVLANLLGNAWKYTARRDRARIELVRVALAEGGFAFCVRDNGPGFDMAYVDKLFAPFQRLHSAHEFEGSGIGLALVQRIVRRHGGRAWAEAEVEGGARFYFTLPDP